MKMELERELGVGLGLELLGLLELGRELVPVTMDGWSSATSS